MVAPAVRPESSKVYRDPTMPLYDYICPANGERVEVRHGMREQLRTWGELCERAGLAPGPTPADSPVERQMGGGMILLARPVSESGGGDDGHSCGPGCCHH